MSDHDIEQLVRVVSPTDYLVAQGGVIVLRPLIVHASSKSHSDYPRRVIHIEYAACRNFGDGLELAMT